MNFCLEIDQLDRLPLAAEIEYRSRLRTVATRIPAEPENPRQKSAYFRARARLSGMLEQDPLPWARRSIEWASAHQQWDELEATLQFLRSLQGETPKKADPEGLRALFAALLQVAQCDSHEQLRETALNLLSSLTTLENCSWHEKSDAHWRCLAWKPIAEPPRVSHQLLERCAEKRQMLCGASARLGDSPSLALSETAGVTVLPLVGQGKTLAVLYSTSVPRDDELKLLPFVAELTATVLERLRAQEEEQRAGESAAMLNQRWREVMQAGPVGMALYSRDGRCLEKNPAFSQLRAEELAWSAPGGQLRSELVMQRLPWPRWLQVADWTLPQQDVVIRTVTDISGDEPERWLRFLEESQHQLAADVHDGPAQIAAAASMGMETPETQKGIRLLRMRLNQLRSPWLEGQGAMSCLQRLQPFLGFDLDWQASPDDSSPEVLTSCRIFQIVLGELHKAQCIEIRVGSRQAQISWRGSPRTFRKGDSWTWIERRLELVGGTVELGQRLLSLRYPDTDS